MNKTSRQAYRLELSETYDQLHATDGAEDQVLRRLCADIQMAQKKAEAARGECEMLQMQVARWLDRNVSATANSDVSELGSSNSDASGFESIGDNAQVGNATDDSPKRFYHLLSTTEPGDDLHIYKMWITYAQEGELDLYTTFALSYVLNGFSTDTNLVLLHLLSVMLLQFVVPILMLEDFGDVLTGIPENAHLDFRIAGFLLYVYSVWNMYDCAQDECRSLMLEWSFKFRLPLRFLWPILIGDILNALTSSMMVVCLFSIYIRRETVAELLIDCVALNFLGNIDNNAIDWSLRDRSIAMYCKLIGPRIFAKTISNTSACWRVSESCCNYIVLVLRIIGTLGLGHTLAFVFLIRRA